MSQPFAPKSLNNAYVLSKSAHLPPSSSSTNANGSGDDSANPLNTNLDELKWFEHRWLDRHGKNSQLKELREKMTLMRRWFESLDADGSGEVGLDELEDPLVSVGLARSRDDVQKLIDEVDKDGKGEVTFDQFLHLMYPKKAKRSRHRAPLHQPKARAQVEDSQVDSPHASKVDATRPSSPLASLRGTTMSPRGKRENSKQIACTSGESSQPKVNPVVKLFEDLQSGKLGDLAIPFPVLITAYRRRMLLNAHMADDPTARRYLDIFSMNAILVPHIV